ncbi:MAG: lamin tail domain-containing protein [Ignavibacteriaceae bacterium]|nr:lamin tail domain-containing protein [Ignavibacteriaceae bacterium]
MKLKNLHALLLFTSFMMAVGFSQPKMNEVYSRGTSTDPDWIEIYNPSSSEIDISGYKIYDIGGLSGSKSKKILPAGTILQAKSFYVVTTDNTGDTTDFGISNNGETVWLEDATGFLIDSVVIPALGSDTSYARMPDGADTFIKLTPPTKGSANQPVVPVELVSFIASASNDCVNLKWMTVTETNNSGFEIQRRKYDEDFTGIGFVKGFGTSTEKHKYEFLDENPGVGVFQYRLKQIDFSGSYSYSNIVESEVTTIPKTTYLQQNYPNPFNPVTSINYSMSVDGMVTLKVFNVLGNEVAQLVNQFQNAGSYSIQFPANGFNLPSGTYFYELVVGGFKSVKKMQLIK